MVELSVVIDECKNIGVVKKKKIQNEYASGKYVFILEVLQVTFHASKILFQFSTTLQQPISFKISNVDNKKAPFGASVS